MFTTLLLTVIMMIGLFLMLLSAVGFIQDKRFFTSAPEDIQAAVRPRPERFSGAHAIGWTMMALAIAMMLSAMALGAWDGIRNGYGYMLFFGRFLIMFWGLKVYDILFFDWVLLCHSGFFPFFYPETKELVGPHQFGYNRRSHVLQAIGMLAVSAVLAWICTLF